MDGSLIDRARFAMSTAPKQAGPPYKFVDVGKASLRVFDRGSGGPTFVLTTDPPNVLEHHEVALASLSKHGRAIGLELPGFGHSRPAPSFRFSIDENADVLLAALDRLGVDQGVLVFPCIAGLVALEAARRAPDRVAGVVVAQTPSFEDALAWSERVDFRGLIRTPVVGQLLVRALRRPLARSWYRAALPRDADTTEYLMPALEAYAHGADYSLASVLQAVRRAEAPSSQITVPVLSVWGRRDRTHRQSDPLGALALAPRGRSVIFEESAHFPDLEEPARFEQEVLRFVKEEVL